LTLAEIEGARGELTVLPQIVDDYAAAGAPTGAAMRAFEERFWTAVARAGGNRIYITEHAWWYRLLDEHPAAHHPALAAPPQRIAFYRELTRRLITDGGAAKMYLDIARGLLAAARKPRRRSP
jgi:DNA-binding FadR family transcriptional regulator